MNGLKGHIQGLKLQPNVDVIEKPSSSMGDRRIVIGGDRTQGDNSGSYCDTEVRGRERQLTGIYEVPSIRQAFHVMTHPGLLTFSRAPCMWYHKANSKC